MTETREVKPVNACSKVPGGWVWRYPIFWWHWHVNSCIAHTSHKVPLYPCIQYRDPGTQGTQGPLNAPTRITLLSRTKTFLTPKATSPPPSPPRRNRIALYLLCHHTAIRIFSGCTDILIRLVHLDTFHFHGHKLFLPHSHQHRPLNTPRPHKL